MTNAVENLVTLMNVLITDDHELVREGLRLLVKRLMPEANMFEASNIQDMNILIQQQANWDLLIIDLAMPGSKLYQGVKLARLNAPSAPVVVISASEENDVIKEVLALGVKGYIPKSASADLMVHAINLILAGGRYFPESLLHLPVENKLMPKDSKNASSNNLGLTKRQYDVVLLLTSGMANKEIGRELDMSEATVRTHMTAIFKVLKVQNRTQAVIVINKLVGPN